MSRISNPQRYLRAIASQPWAIAEDKAQEILAYLDLRADGGERTDDEVVALVRNRRDNISQQTSGVAVIPLFGVIAPRMDAMTALSGGTSCEAFARLFDAAVANENVSDIVIHVDSPGGSVQGVPELSQRIFDARGKKRIIAVADGGMASAAYFIASSADEVVVTPSGAVGAIGVFAIHTDVSRAEDAAGVTRTIVRAGRFKAETNPHEPLSDDAHTHMQEMVNDFYDMFTSAVARNRGVDQSAVENGFGEGRSLTSARAVGAGLADSVETLEQVLERLGVSVAQLSAARADADVPAIETLAPAATGYLPAVAKAEQPHAAATDPPAVTIPRQNRPTEQPSDADGAAPDTYAESPSTEAPSGQEEPTMETELSKHGVEPTVTAGADLGAERERAGVIADLCSYAGIPDRAGEFIASEQSVTQVRETIRAEAETKLAAMSAGPAVDLTEREAKHYSLTRAIMAQAEQGENWSGFERDVSDEIAKNLPKDYKGRGGIFVPTRDRHLAGGSRPMTEHGINRLSALLSNDAKIPFDTRLRLMNQLDTMRAALDSGTAGAGQELMFTEAGDFIDMLRARMKVAELGATVLTGLQGNVAFPRQTGAGTFSWVAEDPGSDQADSDAVLAQVALNSKTGQSSTAYSRQLLNQGIVDVDNLVKNDLALITALGIDLAGINGSGASNQPTGVLNTSGIGSVAIGTNGGAPTYAHVVDLETDVATANADVGTMAYLTTPGVRGKLKKTEEFGSSNGRPVWTGGMEGELNGYRAEVSTQVPSGGTKGTGTNLHAIIFGVWSQLMIGYWGAYELVVDPYSKKKQGLIELTSFQQAGIAVRNPESFSAVVDADIS